MQFVVHVSTVIAQEDKILLVQERKPGVYGLYNFPGGHLEYGEDIITGAKREVHEEVGLAVNPESLFGVFTDFGQDHYINFVFLATIRGTTAKTAHSQILNHQWLTPEEILALPDAAIINPRKVKTIISQFRQKKIYPLDLIYELKPAEAALYVAQQRD